MEQAQRAKGVMGESSGKGFSIQHYGICMGEGLRGWPLVAWRGIDGWGFDEVGGAGGGWRSKERDGDLWCHWGRRRDLAWSMVLLV